MTFQMLECRLKYLRCLRLEHIRILVFLCLKAMSNLQHRLCFQVHHHLLYLPCLLLILNLIPFSSRDSSSSESPTISNPGNLLNDNMDQIPIVAGLLLRHTFLVRFSASICIMIINNQHCCQSILNMQTLRRCLQRDLVSMGRINVRLVKITYHGAQDCLACFLASKNSFM